MATKFRSVNRGVRGNRGPAAAAENRAAILSAAREVFEESGYRVPLSTIARRAGVSQGVFYRHFPRRADLALAVFAGNFHAMEQILADGGDRALFALWDWLLQRAVVDFAFVEMLREQREAADYDGAIRMESLLDAALLRAQQAKVVSTQLRAGDLLRAWRMAYGLAVTTLDRAALAEELPKLLSLSAVERLFTAD